MTIEENTVDTWNETLNKTSFKDHELTQYKDLRDFSNC